MADLTPVVRAIDFVEAHLKDEITVADIAEAASYSVYHFCRVFNRFTQHSPYDYLMRRRLAESARELVETERRIIDVAFDYQFGSPEAFSRAFRRMFGLQPRQWKRRGGAGSRMAMARMTPAHLEHRNRPGGARPTLETRDAIQVAGVMTLVGSDRSAIPELWDLLARELERTGSVRAGSYYGIASYPENWQQRGFFYMAGIESGSPDVVGCTLVTKTMPPSDYARFAHKGPYGDVQLTLDYAYQTWLPRSGRSLAYPLEIECYGRSRPGPEDKALDLEILLPVGESAPPRRQDG